jgi:hypothetical protein
MNIYDEEQNYKLETYNFLMDTYIDTIHKLIDTSYSMNILPYKIIFGMNYIKKYINENRFESLQNGINYLLTNKETILNFDLSKLNELDEDDDSNISIKSCVNKFKNQHSVNKSNNIEFNSNSDDMLNLIIEIKNNTKKLLPNNVMIIKKYFELLIIILEKIQNLFL